MSESSSRSSLEIQLVGMRFHARVGIMAHEREIPQPLEMDLTVRRTSDAVGVLDYRELYDIAKHVVERAPLDYLETVAAAVAERVLAIKNVGSVRVAVRKPHVALGGPLEYAGIILERARD